MSNPPTAAWSSKRIALVAGLGIFAFAFLLRLWGIGWGLPNDLRNQSLHPDELVVWNYSQQIEPAKGKFDPGFYNYGTLYLTLLRVASDMTAAYTGGPDPAVPDSQWQFIGRAHFSGRILSALAGAGTAAVVFFILRRRTTTFGAVFGGLALAVAPAFVVHSRFQTVDVTATFLLALSLLYALRLLPGEDDEGTFDIRTAALAGLFAGLSAGTKYTGILALVSLYIVLALAKRPGALRLGAVATGTALLAFVLATPGVLLNTGQFVKDFVYELQHTSTGHGFHFEGTPSGFLYHLVNLQSGMGTLLFLGSLIGLGYATYRRHPWAIALAAFFLLQYILIGRAEVKFLRYTFPLMVPLAIGFGYAMGTARRKGGRAHLLVAGGLLAIGGFDPGGLRQAMVFSYQMASPDARDVAATWLRTEAEKTPGATVGLVSDPWYYTPPTFKDTGLFRGIPMLRRMILELGPGANPPTLRYVPEILRDPANWSGETIGQKLDWDVRLLTETKPTFVVYSNYEVGDVIRLREVAEKSEPAKNLVAQADEFFKVLERDYERTQKFSTVSGSTMAETQMVHDMMYVQPVVYIWKRKAP